MVDTRRHMLPLQEAVECQPIQYSLLFGRPSFGAPTTLNTNIAAAAFHHNQQQNPLAPFLLRPLGNGQIPTARSILGRNFNRNKYCWRCGFRRKVHSRQKVPFGDNCNNTCNFEHCSKCGQRTEIHDTGNRMGPTCVLATFAGSECHDWYKPTMDAVPRNATNNII
jgi:hypothetical protein